MIIKSFLSDQCIEIILGSILGDGSLRIQKPYKNARFSFRHSISQKEYFFWKVNQLREISSDKCWWRQKADGYGGEKLRYQSLATESLTKMYNMTNCHNQIAIKRKWLNILTPLSLAIWWLDDGSIIGNGRKGVLCTDPFSLNEQKILARYLSIVWKVRVAIGKITRKRENGQIKTYYRLWFRSSEELKKFIRIILPQIRVESMLPKVILLYNDSQLQQRWISEIVNNTNFSFSIIEKYLNKKKGKCIRFQKMI